MSSACRDQRVGATSSAVPDLRPVEASRLTTIASWVVRAMTTTASVGVRVLLAVRYVRRDEDVVARAGLDAGLHRLRRHRRRGRRRPGSRRPRRSPSRSRRGDGWPRRWKRGTWVCPIQRLRAPTVFPLIASSRRIPASGSSARRVPRGATRCRARWNGSMTAGTSTPLGLRTRSSEDPAGTCWMVIRLLRRRDRVGPGSGAGQVWRRGPVARERTFTGPERRPGSRHRAAETARPSGAALPVGRYGGPVAPGHPSWPRSDGTAPLGDAGRDEGNR